MKIWFDFCFKSDQNFIKNVSKNCIEFKVRFGSRIFSIFCDFFTNFGPNLVPKWSVQMSWNQLWNVSEPQVDSKGCLWLILDPQTSKNVIWPQQNALWCPFWMWKPKIFATRFLTSLPFFNQKGPLGVQIWYQMTTFALAGTPFSWVSDR